MYDPSVGRWLERDPLGFAARDPNLYRYVENNPPNYVDPTGLDPESRARIIDDQAKEQAIEFQKQTDRDAFRGAFRKNNLDTQVADRILDTLGKISVPEGKEKCIRWTECAMEQLPKAPALPPGVIIRYVRLYYYPNILNGWDYYANLHQLVYIRLPQGQEFYIDDGWWSSYNGGIVPQIPWWANENNPPVDPWPWR